MALRTVALPVRRKIVEKEALDESDVFGLRELGDKAASVLGYTVLRERVEVEKGKQQVLATLVSLDAAPFTPESVEKYKREQVRRDRPWFFHLHRLIRRVDDNPVGLVGVIGILGVVVAVVAMLFSAWVLASFVWPVAIVLLVLSIFMTGHEGYRPAWWKTSELDMYSEPIPEFVLATALVVDEKLPGGQFFVEEFVSGRKDPFLIWKYQNDKYFLHVWNESKFKGKRQV